MKTQTSAPADRHTGPAATTSAGEDMAGALHEVSNALTVVLGWLQHAQTQLGTSGPAAEAIEVACRHAALGHGIARRAVGASVEDSTDPISSQQLLDQLVVSATQEAATRGVELQMLNEAQDVWVTEVTSAQQILLNLVLNALSFTPRHGCIRLTARSEQTQIVFRVHDDGPGVPAEVRRGLFARANSLRPGGAGIGLTHSHHLAEQCGGDLTLLQRVQGGACFQLRLPTTAAASQTVPCSRGDAELADTSDRPSRPQKTTLRSLHGLSVAVLEDDADVMGMLELGLGSRGVRLYPLPNREALFEFAQSGPVVDAILIDLSPIASDPEGAIRRLRTRSPKASVFLISGTVLSTDAGPDIAGWIRKPFELGEVYAALQRLPDEPSGQ